LEIDANAWRIAQNLEHLTIVNQTYFPLIEQSRNSDYKLPWAGFTLAVAFL
jgi:hypothetical protein